MEEIAQRVLEESRRFRVRLPELVKMYDGRWVVFEYCISLIAVTLRRPSRPIHLHPGQKAWTYGLPYVAVSLLFGWWGLPWGVLYTPLTIFTNLTGVGNIEVNAFQRLSNVVIQKSSREGFGLVVSEMLWKGTPVVAGRAGAEVPFRPRSFVP